MRTFDRPVGASRMLETPTFASLLLQWTAGDRAARAAVYALLQEVESYPPHPGSVQFMIEHQRRHYAADVAWIDDVINQVKSSKNDSE